MLEEKFIEFVIYENVYILVQYQLILYKILTKLVLLSVDNMIEIYQPIINNYIEKQNSVLFN